MRLEDFTNTNANWAGCSTNRKSTSHGVFSTGSVVVSWYSMKQKSITLSLVEVKYMVVSLATCKAIWMRKLLAGLFRKRMRPIMIHCDNQSCIKLSQNPVFHDRSKHIEIKYHHLKDWG